MIFKAFERKPLPFFSPLGSDLRISSQTWWCSWCQRNNWPADATRKKEGEWMREDGEENREKKFQVPIWIALLRFSHSDIQATKNSSRSSRKKKVQYRSNCAGERRGEKGRRRRRRRRCVQSCLEGRGQLPCLSSGSASASFHATFLLFHQRTWAALKTAPVFNSRQRSTIWCEEVQTKDVPALGRSPSGMGGNCALMVVKMQVWFVTQKKSVRVCVRVTSCVLLPGRTSSLPACQSRRAPAAGKMDIQKPPAFPSVNMLSWQVARAQRTCDTCLRGRRAQGCVIGSFSIAT